MKKILVALMLFLVSLSLFAEDSEAKESNKNVFRVYPEAILVFETDPSVDSWAAGQWDYALAGLGFSYSRLFTDKIGMTIVIGVLAGGVDQPFSDEMNVDFFAGSYPLDINKVGVFGKIGPYFKVGRMGISAMVEGAVIVGGDLKDESAENMVDQLVGVSLGAEYFITDSFVVYVEGSALAGYRINGSLLSYWDGESSHDFYTFFEKWNDSGTLDIMALSVAVGVGISF